MTNTFATACMELPEIKAALAKGDHGMALHYQRCDLELWIQQPCYTGLVSERPDTVAEENFRNRKKYMKVLSRLLSVFDTPPPMYSHSWTVEFNCNYINLCSIKLDVWSIWSGCFNTAFMKLARLCDEMGYRLSVYMACNQCRYFVNGQGVVVRIVQTDDGGC